MTSILLETLRLTDEDHDTYRMESPEIVLQASQTDEIVPVLQGVERLVANGYFAAGFMAYEAGFAFLSKLPSPPSTDLPLIWFGLSRKVKKNVPLPLHATLQDGQQAIPEDLSLNLDRGSYGNSIEKIRDYISKGDTYQVNFTMRYRGRFEGSAAALYEQLRKKQGVSYAAYIETDDWAILSLSPELFFRKRKNEITVRPMKGTAPRGRTLQEDKENAQRLISSPKEMSENLMIVDLLRNDLGKVCEPGSIQVTRAMEVERYETLLQMTSNIRGILKPDIKLIDLMRAAFPSGSVTGAPKLRTMQIIHELEREPRSIYTGAIGFLSGEDACFNVAIRTAVVNKRRGTIEMGVGSGILFEADPSFEYDECKLKGNFLTQASPEFQLLETLLWEPEGGFRHLELHLSRLLSSAEYFLFSVEPGFLRALLSQKCLEYSQLYREPQRVRLLVSSTGNTDLQVSSLEPPTTNLTVCISTKRTNSADRFLFHKTTHRNFYDQELAAARANGYFEVLFKNEREEITEGAITNVLIKQAGVFYTPPITCGLLPGILRKSLFESKKFQVKERVLFEEDLLKADAVYVCNSVRGLLKVKLVTTLLKI